MLTSADNLKYHFHWRQIAVTLIAIGDKHLSDYRSRCKFLLMEVVMSYIVSAFCLSVPKPSALLGDIPSPGSLQVYITVSMYFFF